MPTSTRRPRPDDAAVPIDGRRVDAVRQARGLTRRALALKARMGTQQAMDLICRGTTKRTTWGKAKRIARVLGVPPEWLTNEWRNLPGASYRGGLATFLDRSSLPDRVQLAEHELRSSARPALERHRQRLWAAVKNHRREQASADREYIDVQLWVEGLTEPEWWIWALSQPQPEGAEGGLNAGLSLTEHTEATEALSRAFRIILRPWLEGRAELNVEMIRIMTRDETRPRPFWCPVPPRDEGAQFPSTGRWERHRGDAARRAEQEKRGKA